MVVLEFVSSITPYTELKQALRTPNGVYKAILEACNDIGMDRGEDGGARQPGRAAGAGRRGGGFGGPAAPLGFSCAQGVAASSWRPWGGERAVGEDGV